MIEILKVGLCTILAVLLLVGICCLLIFAPVITLLVCLAAIAIIIIGSIAMLIYTLIFG